MRKKPDCQFLGALPFLPPFFGVKKTASHFGAAAARIASGGSSGLSSGVFPSRSGP